jgi:hypothetical protein
MELRSNTHTVEFKLGFRALQNITAALEINLKDLGHKIDDGDMKAIEVIAHHATGLAGEALEELLDTPGMFNQIRVAFIAEFSAWMGLAEYAEEVSAEPKKPKARK